MKCALIVLLAGMMPAYAETISGPARVIDGDTIEITGRRIRLYGIDALELHQRCSDGFSGADAARYLNVLIGDKPVRCERWDIDHYGRVVGVCFNTRGDDLNRAMTEAGHAFAYVYYSTRYVDAERLARAHGLGIFKPNRDCEVPWQWRKEHR